MELGHRYAAWQDGLQARVGEGGDLFADDPAMLPELEWQSRWFRGAFGRDFLGTEGEAVRIVQFGVWNRSAGPDFLDAVVEIDGEAHRGAVELDHDARDWERHGHGANPAFEEVVLHLFFRGPNERWFTRTAGHRRVVQVVLDPAACDEAVRACHAAARPGRCASVMAGLSAGEVEQVLLEAAAVRARDQARRFRVTAGIHGRDEAWFQAVAVMLGYHANQLPMRVLAQRVSLKALRSMKTGREALLMGQAGFLEGDPAQVEGTGHDYLRALWKAWWKLRGDLDPRRLPDWSLVGIRPANHPPRRVAALAAVAADWPGLAALLEADPVDPGTIQQWFTALDHPFWSCHYSLKGDRLESPVALVGADRVRDFLGNTVFPVHDLAGTDAWRRLPGSTGNSTLRRAAARVLAGRTDARRFTGGGFAVQQGLLQIYRDICQRDRTDCLGCPFPEAAPGLAGAEDGG